MQEASKLQVFAYIAIPLQFTVDSVIFKVEYSLLQHIGLAIFISLYLLIIVRYCIKLQRSSTAEGDHYSNASFLSKEQTDDEPEMLFDDP